MRIGIIAAMEQEMTLLVSVMKNVREEVKHHLTFYVGDIGKHNIILVKSGIGKVNSAIATTLLLTHYDIDKVINTGSAGSLSNLSIGDVVISDRVAYHDVDALAFGYKIGQVPQMPEYYEADKELIRLAYQAVTDTRLRAHIGQILSSDSFIADQNKIEKIKEDFPFSLCTEMEGASIAQTCHVFNVPFVIVRAISDNADGQAHMSFDEFIIEAGEKSAQMVLNLLELL